MICWRRNARSRHLCIWWGICNDICVSGKVSYIWYSQALYAAIGTRCFAHPISTMTFGCFLPLNRPQNLVSSLQPLPELYYPHHLLAFLLQQMSLLHFPSLYYIELRNYYGTAMIQYSILKIYLLNNKQI